MPIQNVVRNLRSECQVVLFNWKSLLAREELSLSELIDSNPIDISKYLLECDFTKTLSAPSGTFQITLPNDRDWKQVIQRGVWGIVYMSQDGGLSIPRGSDTPNITLLQNQTNKIRGIIYVERVAAKGMVGAEAGEFDVEFVLTGRDFGVVYEENEIWYNRLYAEGKIQEAAAGELSVQKTRNTTNLLKTFHKAFFSPQDLGITLEGDSITKAIPLQWILPPQMFQALNLVSKNKKTHFGSIEGLFDSMEETLCSYPVENPMTLINGKAWDILKSHSIEQFHELFPETNDSGKPQLYFRYIPWKTTSGRALGKLNPKVKAFTDVERVKLETVNLLDWDLGEDTHSRYNYFLTVVDTSKFTAEDTLAAFKDKSPETGFPRIQKNSIRRYGLRLLYSTINALIQLGTEKADPNLLILHNELMLEYWNNSVFMESGTATIVGDNKIKLGKVLEFAPGAPYNGGKLFYIEGYADKFVSDEKGAGFWTQTLTLTRGIYPGKISKRGEEYTDNGEFTETR